jgi:imidazoleglycerol-phosphate dehydratase
LRRAKSEVELGSARALVNLDLDGSGKAKLASGSAFLDHMMNSLARTGGLDLEVSATGGAYYSAVAIGRALGQSLDQALGDKSGIRRYGWAAVPMDESSAEVALDISGRPYLIFKGAFWGERIGDLEVQNIQALIDSMATAARLTVHIRFYGENDHHQAESIFKALGLALKGAVELAGTGIPSTKGVI